MEIVKGLMLIVCFFICNYIGKSLSYKYKYRLEELREMKSALNIFKTKIKFTYEPIPEIFNEISKNTNKSIGNIFICAKENMQNKNAEDSWNDALNNCENYLNDEDKKTLSVLAKMLGKSDLEGQTSQIDITLDFLEKQINDAEIEKNKNERLYKKLGTIIGFALVIILI